MINKYEYIYDYMRKSVAVELRELCYTIILQNAKTTVINALIAQEENLFKHCIFLTYYTIYRTNSQTKSIRKHLGAKEREEEEYDHTLYAYKKYRIEKDKQSNFFFNDKNFPGLYNNFSNKSGEKISSLKGQQLSDSAFFEISLIKKYSIYELILHHRIQSSKKCSNYIFEEDFFPQVEEIYHEINSAFSTYEFPYFMKSVEYYALEAAYSFEKAYHMAKKLKDLKLKKDMRDREKEILSNILIFKSYDHLYSNCLILGYDEIFRLYNYPQIDAHDIYDIVHCCCHIINTIVSNFLIENHDSQNWSISSEVDSFCKSFFGQGQHISSKNLNDIRIKDFRDFYK